MLYSLLFLLVPQCAGLAIASGGRLVCVAGKQMHCVRVAPAGYAATETLMPPGLPVRYMVTLRQAALAAACILVPLVAGAAVGILTMSGITGWYATLNKPWFTPPDYVFGPVWTILYILMGISLYLVIAQGWEQKPVKQGVLVFATQLAVNILWSFLFFGFHSPVAGLVCILVLLALIVATMVAFRRVSKTATLLLVPYLAWVCIATALNAAVVLLN